MNHIYRNVWNEVTRTYVAAAEIVRGRGKRSKSSVGAEGAEAALAASSLLSEGESQANAPPKRRKLHMSLPRSMALEQRFMFDGAAFGDAVQVMDRTGGDLVRHAPVDRFASRADAAAVQGLQGTATSSTAGAVIAATAPDASLARPTGVQLDLQIPADQAPANVLAAQAEAQRLVSDFLAQPDVRERLYALFNGGDASARPSDAWNEAAQALLQSLTAQGETVRLELRSAAEMPTARGAFAALGPQGTPVIYLNADWAATQASPQAIADVMVEEIGHYLDARINGLSDTAGDEGERFAYALTHGSNVTDGVGADDDHGVLSLDGVAVDVELASLTFPNPGGGLGSSGSWGAYRINDNQGEAKESNQHTYDPNPASTFNQITKVVITDGLSVREFSGNDVSVLATFTFADNHTETYAGWISRPVKSGGVVQGFYFWTDTNFNPGNPPQADLNLARQDGNNDADNSSLDNTAFLIAWNKTYFAGSGNSKTVGSSSDRVDSALNSLLPSNNPPTSVADAATVTEAGGVRTNLTASTTATGNVLTNDLDDAGDAKSVTKVGTTTATATVTAGSTSASGATVVNGSYGDLTIGADGSYNYGIRSASNTLAVMEALRTSSNTLTDTFTYTMADGAGVTTTTTLTVTIQGNNDNPTANPDVNTAKESLLANSNTAQYTSTDPLGAKAVGNVLSNDSDVDLNGEGSAVTGIGTTTTGTTPQTVTVSTIPLDSVIGIVSRASQTARGDAVFTLVNGIWTDTSYRVYDIDATAKTLRIYNGTQQPSIPADLSTLTISSGQELRFYATTTSGAASSPLSSEATAQVTLPGATTASTSVLVNSVVGIGVGSSVTGSGVAANTTVTAINASTRTITLSQAVALDNVSLTFGATAGSTVSGRYGSLVLSADGTYTYTPTALNPDLNEGQTVTEVFNYTMRDTAGAQSSSTLTITLTGSGANDPDAKADTATAREAGGVGNTSAGINPTGNVLGGAGAGTGDVADSTPGGTTGPTVSAITTGGGTAGTLGSPLTGQFGQLTLSSTGAYTYTVTNSNETVQALRTSSQTLTDTFVYTITNDLLRTDTATLTITIEGANDNPVAVADAASLSEDNVVVASGNVLTNDTDVDSDDTKKVTKASAGANPTSTVSGGTNSSSGLSIIGTYGTVRIGSDGTYRYELNNSAAIVQNLIKDQQVTDQFSYEVTDTANTTHTATLTFTITGANEPPVNQFNGSSFSSTLQTSVTGTANTVLAFTGTRLLSVAEPDNNLSSTVLTVENGSLSFSASTSGGLSPSTGSTVTIIGTRDQVNEALARLQYTPTSNFTGADFLTINSVDSEGARDIDGVAINIPTTFTGPTVNESDLASGSTPNNTGETANVTLSAPSGQSFGSSNQSGADGSIGSWTLNASTGVFTYTLTSPVAISGTSSTRDVTVTTFDQFGNSITNPVTVTVTNDSPMAVADTTSITEDASPNNVTGNVITGTGTGSVTDTASADGSTTVVGVAAGNTSANLNDSNTVGADITSSNGYGKINIASTGAYTYTLDNTNATVQARNTGQTLTDYFVYTIKDADGSLSNTTVTITINGANESGPTLTITDNNGNTTTGQESVAENSSISSKTFTVSAPGGLSKITVAGTDVTLNQLNNAGTTPVNINTTKGVLTITGYSSGTGVVTYSYDPTGTSQNHTSGEVSDPIAISVTDTASQSTSGTLTILITDTGPIANADTTSITEDASPNNVTGNVITGTGTGSVTDTASADGSTTVVGVAAGNTSANLNDSNTVGADITSSNGYGKINIASTGAYTYTLDNTNATVQARNTGQTLTDYFVYTIKDADGSLSNTTVTITINGANESGPTLTITDNNGNTTTGQESVAENSSISSKTFTVSAPGGLSKITVAGTDVTLNQLNNAGTTPVNINTTKGVLTITGYSSGTGVVTYSYDPTGTSQNHTSGEVSDPIAISVTDTASQSTSGTLTILITDTGPIANADTTSITEDASPNNVTGNVITGTGTGSVTDTASADGSTTVVGVAAGNTSANLNDSNTVGADITSSNGYGKINIASTGAYTYTLDNTNATVQARNTGQTLTDYFVYTIKDADGSLSNTTVTITINGANESGPTLTITDNNGNTTTGQESVAENSSISSKTFTVSAPGGLSKITVAGTDVTLNQLNNAGTTPVNINTTKGVLTITGYSSGTGVVTYSYDPTGTSQNHTSGEVSDPIAISVTDTASQSTSGTLTILITDTGPIANADTTSITEDASPNNVTGNVITGTGTGSVTDTASADGSTTVVGVAAGNTSANLNDSNTVGADITSSNGYGKINIASTGAYTYTLDNTNATVQARNTGQTLTDYFVYTIKDADGSLSNTTVTITINGANDTPVITVVDVTGAVTEDTATVADNANTVAVETGSYLSDTGSVTFDDVDTGNTSTVTVALVGAHGSSSSVKVGSALRYWAMFDFAAINGNTGANWPGKSSNLLSKADYPTLTNAEFLALGYELMSQSSGGIGAFVARYTDNTQTTIVELASKASLANAGNRPSGDGTNFTTNTGQQLFVRQVDLAAAEAALSRPATAVSNPSGGLGDIGTAMKVTGAGTSSPANDGTVNWAFALDNSKIQYLKAGETITATYRISVKDNSGVSAASGGDQVDTATQLVTVTITGTNEVPVAVDDNLGTNANAAKTITSAELFGADGTGNNNDLDADAASFASITVTSLTANGTLKLNGAAVTLNQVISATDIANNQLTFEPAVNFSGNATFKYRVSDGALLSNEATVTIAVAPPGTPVAVDDFLTGTEDTTKTISSAELFGADGTGNANDRDMDSANFASITITELGANGTLKLDGTPVSLNQVITAADVAAGKLNFQPANNFNGNATFKYTVSDGATTSNFATVTIAVGPVNDAPVAVDDSFATSQNSPRAISSADLFGADGTGNTNDRDIDSANFTSITITDVGANGTLKLDGTTVTLNQVISAAEIAAGKLTFEPLANFNGSANFKYTASDGTASSNQATVTITVAAISAPPTTLSVTGRTVNESAGTLTFTVSLSNAITQALTFTPSLSNGTATVGADTGANAALEFFDGTTWVPASSGVTIAAGATSVMVRTQVTNDSAYEGSESFTLSTGAVTVGSTTATALTNPTGASGTGIIFDDGTGGDDDGDGSDNASDTAKNNDTPTISSDNVTVAEGASAVFTVSLSNTSTTPVSFTPTLSNGSATLGADTAASNTLEVSTDGGNNWSTVSGAVTIASGQNSVKLRLATTDDAVAEFSETFTLATSTITGTVSNASGVMGTATITDNDAAPSYSINDVTVNEAAGTMTFTVTRAGSTGAASSVQATTSNGSASAGSDYTPVATTTLNFAISETTRSFTVPITDDNVFEGSETITVTLSNASAGTSITDATGIGTIKDDGTGGDDDGNNADNTTDTAKNDDRPRAIDDAFTIAALGGNTGSVNIISRNDGPAPSTQLSIQSISFIDTRGLAVNASFGSLQASNRIGFDKQAVLADGVVHLKADGTSFYEHAGRRFLVTAVNPNGTLEYNSTGAANGWAAVALNESVIVTLADIDNGRIRYTPQAAGADIGQRESTVAQVVELDWRTDSFSYTIADAGGAANSTAKVLYSVTDPGEAFRAPVSPGPDIDVDGITTTVESVLANRARGLAGIQTGTRVLDLANVLPAGSSGASVVKIGMAFDGDLNIDQPESLGDGFQNGVTTFSWINASYFGAANADPFTSDLKAIVSLVAEDTASSNRVPDPLIQMRNVRVDALTQEQVTQLQSFLRFTPGWSPLGFSAELRSDAPAGTTNIDQDPTRPGFQWRFTVDISRTGETVDTFMAFIKWVDQATIDAYRAANLPLVDLLGDPITKPGWVDFTRITPGGDGVGIGTSGANVLLLDYTITDNAFGDLDLRLGYISDPGMPVFIVRTIDVSGAPDVAEGSTAVFSVKLNAPKSAPTEVTLALADSAGGTDSLNGVPQDFSTSLTAHYFDASGAKQNLPVTAGRVTLPAKVTEFFVSVPTIEDTPFEGAEAFTLKATLPEGIADSDAATIIDDGSGKVYDERGVVVPGVPVADDRPLSVNSITVNEGSPFAVFSVNGAANQLASFAVANGTAGSADFGPGLQVWNGSAWVAYAGGSTALNVSGKALLRTPVLQDAVYEGTEVFTLTASNTGGSSVTGTGTINDDGTGDKFTDAPPGPDGNPTKDDSSPRDDDRGIAVSSIVVNEGSPFAVFTVSGTPRQGVNLTLSNGTAGSSDYGPRLEVWNGSAWVPHAGAVVALGADGLLLVRTPVLQDTIFEGAEVFTLTATVPGGKAGSGNCTIVDDGTGDKFPNAPPGPDGTPSKGTGPFDDDRALSVNSVTVNEGSPFAVFTVSGLPGQAITLALADGTAGSADYGLGLEVWNGTAWVPYTGGTVTLDASGKLLVRTPIKQDTVFEGAETFTLTAAVPGGKSGTGTATIVDDGTGDKFPDAPPGPDGAPPKGPGPFDDDRALSVNSVTVNEGSPFAVFTVSGVPGQAITLALADGTAGSADYGSGLEVWSGTAWVPYTSGTVTLDATGKALMRTPIKQDTVFEGAETFTLTAAVPDGKSGTGTATIVDDGTGDKFPDAPPGPDGAPPKGPGPFDDDRALSVNSVTVSEASPFAVFTVTASPGQLLGLALESGTATVGTDTETALQFFDGAIWRDYTPGTLVAVPAGRSALLVRVAIAGDTPLEGPESFQFVATNTGGTAARGTGTLVDDGTNGNFFEPGNSNGIATPGIPDDDTPPPPPPPPPAPPKPAPVPEAPPPPPPPTPAPAPVAQFDSAVSATKPPSLPLPDRPAIGDILTSASGGFRAQVVKSEVPALMRDKGITDQFVEPNRTTTFNLPSDAFAHTRSEAVLTVTAQQTSGQPLPNWVLFNAQAGTFLVTPPPGFTGELEVQVIVRDNDGREATANFKFNVGAGTMIDTRPPAEPAPPPPRPVGRLGITDQIRLAGRQNGLLDRLMSSRTVQERLQERTEALMAAEKPNLREGKAGEPQAGTAQRHVTLATRAPVERVQPTAVPRPGA